VTDDSGPTDLDWQIELNKVLYYTFFGWWTIIGEQNETDNISDSNR